jgi:hypothetical protein
MNLTLNYSRHINLILIVIFAGLFSFSNDCKAKEAPGYIITEKHDTISGVVELSWFDQLSGGLILNGVEQCSFYSRVVFKSKDGGQFHTYFPESILGFGFRHESVNYFYQRFTVERNSILVSESQQYRFLSLLYKGSLELYKDITFIDNLHANTTHERYLSFSNYYLFSPSKGLVRVEKNHEYKNVGDILRHYEIDEKFIATIPNSANFNEIQGWLALYDYWLWMK